MDNQFSRTEILIGKEAIEKLKSSRVIIFGVGGVGGYVVEALARSGIGYIDIVDNDKYVLSNLNRQLHSLHSTLGEYKVDVVKKRILDINPDAIVNTFKLFYTKDTSEINFAAYDYIIDAIDSVSSKIDIIINAKLNDIPIISSMGAGNKMNPDMFEVADISKTSVCPLAKIIRYELRKRKIKNVKVIYSKEIPIKSKHAQKTCDCKKIITGSNAFVPATAGLIIAGEVVKDIIKCTE